jgi:hypothetical protein
MIGLRECVNYGMTAPLKNALDYLSQEWQYKPVGLVSYGGLAGEGHRRRPNGQETGTLGSRSTGYANACQVDSSSLEPAMHFSAANKLFGLTLPVKHQRLYRRTNCLICPVNTAIPTARSANSFLKFCTHPFNMLPSGFRLLNGDGPAYPFIA